MLLYCVNNYSYKCEDKIQIVIIKKLMKHHKLQYVHVADILLVDIVNLNLREIQYPQR